MTTPVDRNLCICNVITRATTKKDIQHDAPKHCR